MAFGCGNSSKKKLPDISEIEVNLEINRFEKDLFSMDTSSMESEAVRLKSEYPGFYDCYMTDIMQVEKLPGDDTLPVKLKNLLNLGGFRASYDSVVLAFPDLSNLESEIKKAFRYLHYYVPEITVPQVVTFVSEFTYGITLCNDSVIGIGLDLFLGKNFSFYPSLYIPQYIIDRLEPEYIVSNLLKSWLTAWYGELPPGSTLLEEMIHKGKILYLTSLAIPESDNYLVAGYTPAQANWCEDNEGEIWAFIKGENLLFEKSKQKTYPFINETPTTPGMPPDSPGNIGSWAGWQIVQSYMREASGITIDKLMQTQNAQWILEQSAYKPRRK